MYFGERLMMLNVEQSSLNSKRYIKPLFFYGIEHSRITWFATLITVVSAGNCSFLYDKQFDFNILNITLENYLKFGSIQLKRKSILSEMPSLFYFWVKMEISYVINIQFYVIKYF